MLLRATRAADESVLPCLANGSVTLWDWAFLMRTLVARRYAKALFELLPERADQDAAAAQLHQLAGHASQVPSLRDLIHNPIFTAPGRESAIAEIAGRLGVSPTTAGLLRLLAKKNRLNLLEEIDEAFGAILDKTRGKKAVRLTVSRPMDDAERARIMARIESVTGTRIALEVVVDPSILGGVIFQVGGTIYDGSLLGRLNALRSRLTEE